MELRERCAKDDALDRRLDAVWRWACESLESVLFLVSAIAVDMAFRFILSFCSLLY